jgi:hypothetical protein
MIACTQIVVLATRYAAVPICGVASRSQLTHRYEQSQRALGSEGNVREAERWRPRRQATVRQLMASNFGSYPDLTPARDQRAIPPRAARTTATQCSRVYSVNPACLSQRLDFPRSDGLQGCPEGRETPLFLPCAGRQSLVVAASALVAPNTNQPPRLSRLARRSGLNCGSRHADRQRSQCHEITPAHAPADGLRRSEPDNLDTEVFFERATQRLILLPALGVQVQGCSGLCQDCRLLFLDCVHWFEA